MEQNDEFIRVGTTYYKIVDQPLVNGETVKRRIPWEHRSPTTGLRQELYSRYTEIRWLLYGSQSSGL